MGKTYKPLELKVILTSEIIICILKMIHFVTFRNAPHIIHSYVFEEGSAPQQMKRVATYPV